MKFPRPVGIAVSLLVVAVVGYVCWLQRERLLGLINGKAAAKAAAATTPVAAPGGQNKQVQLSKQARENLGLFSKPLKLEKESWRKLEIPGVVEDRPGISDRGVVSPVTGLVTRVHCFPGDTVAPGAVLFTMRLVSESLHTSQLELYKAVKEVQIAQEQKKRLTAAGEAVPEVKRIEVDNQIKRNEVVVQAYRQDLQIRGLTTTQIDEVAQGKFVAEVEVRAPLRRATPTGNRVVPATTAGDPDEAFRFEVQELKVDLGQQVQAGQTMCLLADHELLFIEGKCFQNELPLVQQATKERWPLEVAFVEDTVKTPTETTVKWKDVPREFRIQHVANSIDPTSRTLSFFVPLVNQNQTYVDEGERRLLWRYRPGQRVRFLIKVEKFQDVFVLPAAAVVQEGPESFVFQQNDDIFNRLPVHVLYQDRSQAVIANDGSLVEKRMYIAQRGAAQLNRVLKGQANDGPKGHYHADGSFHAVGAPEPEAK